MTSKSKIIEYLKEHGQIDNFYCIDNRITTRLGAVIFKLKQEGWGFRTEMKEKNCFYYVTKKPEEVIAGVDFGKDIEKLNTLFPSYPKLNENYARWRE